MKMTMTLSRAHKLAERIKTKQAALVAGLNSSGSVRIGGQSASQINTLKERKSVVLNDVKAFVLLNDSLTALRQAIGKGNTDSGVSNILAEIDGHNREVNVLKQVAPDGFDISSIQIDELQNYKPMGDGVRYQEPSVTVDILGSDERKQFSAKIEAIRKKVFILTDKMADANAYIIHVEFSDEVTAALGLA